ncbi:DUF6624 domain-containing protein [Nonlabens ulvanivorans]|uniref:Uncharacterized protein n=1 Tax=Nonlabens ulvanivorans TaxID=906888 RepID=A0A084JW17_NONUL|nr:DUF6624 domain-containing protein [Nonlabens ulvanivorans]KEZ93151.1 hypothetical protein IL45_13595 [Nonlabens ulvanivorans]PRX13729.1 hypothetical protein LY02_01977 [Nonlabens ulvanivorans]
MNYPEIAHKIIQLKDADLALRDELIQKGQLGNGYNTDMEQLHIKNADQLDEIINLIGYPTIVKVGQEASEAAWLIIQHAISKPDFMKKCVQLLQHTDHNDTVKLNLVYLTDRIAVFEERQQLYGTQFDWDANGELSPQAYDDLNKVNERRKALDLPTLEEQTQMIRQRAKEEKQSTPTDFEKRKKEIRAWKKKVGWIWI